MSYYNIQIKDSRFDFYEVCEPKQAQNQVEFLWSAREILARRYQPNLSNVRTATEEYQKILSAVKEIKQQHKTNPPPYSNRLNQLSIYRCFQLIKTIFKNIFSASYSTDKRINKLCLQIEALERSYQRELKVIPLEEQYLELIRRLPNEEKEKIENYPLNKPTLDFLSILIDTGDWKGIRRMAAENCHPEGMKELTYHALALTRSGKITISQFSTLMFFLAACKQHGAENVKIIPLFTKNRKNKINPTADRLIRETMKAGDQYFRNFTFFPSEKVTSDQVEVIYAMLKRAPLSEQFLFMVPDTSGHYDPRHKRSSTTITQRIQIEMGFNEFGRIKGKRKGKQQRLISSISSVQALLDTTTPYQFQANPVLGSSSPADIQKNGKNNNRDVQIPYAPYNDGLIPPKADGFTVADQYDMPEHDIFHCKRCASISPEHQNAYIRTVELISNNVLAEQSPLDKEILLKFKKDFRWGIIDMDFPGYKQSNHSLLFGYYLLSLGHRFESATPKLKEQAGLLLNLFAQRVAEDMKKNPKVWENFGISKQTMSDGVRYYEKIKGETLSVQIFKKHFA